MRGLTVQPYSFNNPYNLGDLHNVKCLINIQCPMAFLMPLQLSMPITWTVLSKFFRLTVFQMSANSYIAGSSCEK